MHEILEVLKMAFSPENIKWFVGILAVFGVAIDVTPFIKFNPMRYILRKFGKLINGDLYEKVEIMDQRLERAEAESKKYRMTSLHDRIFQMHRIFLDRGYVTENDLDNFKICTDEYKANNGNGVVKNKIIPEVLSLPIKYKEAENEED